MPQIPPEPDVITDDELLLVLRNASDGLTYPSESDEPFDVFCWKLAYEDIGSQLANETQTRTPVDELTAGEFFTPLLARDEGSRFMELREVLTSHLTNLRVFRVGEIEVDIYVVGRAKSGNWAGVHTVAVET